MILLGELLILNGDFVSESDPRWGEVADVMFVLGKVSDFMGEEFSVWDASAEGRPAELSKSLSSNNIRGDKEALETLAPFCPDIFSEELEKFATICRALPQHFQKLETLSNGGYVLHATSVSTADTHEGDKRALTLRNTVIVNEARFNGDATVTITKSSVRIKIGDVKP